VLRDLGTTRRARVGDLDGQAAALDVERQRLAGHLDLHDVTPGKRRWRRWNCPGVIWAASSIVIPNSLRVTAMVGGVRCASNSVAATSMQCFTTSPPARGR